MRGSCSLGQVKGRTQEHFHHKTEFVDQHSFHFNQVKFDEDEDAFQKMCDSLLFCLNSSFLSLVARTGVGGCTRVGG